MSDPNIWVWFEFSEILRYAGLGWIVMGHYTQKMRQRIQLYRNVGGVEFSVRVDRLRTNDNKLFLN